FPVAVFLLPRRRASTRFPYTTLFRSNAAGVDGDQHPVFALQRGLLVTNRYEPGSGVDLLQVVIEIPEPLDHEAMTVAWRHAARRDRKSTRLNSSHVKISYAVFCLKKK